MDSRTMTRVAFAGALPEIELGSEYNLALEHLSIADDNVLDYLSCYPNVKYYESGRSAIRSISASLNEGDTVLLPEFICESVISCFASQRIVFYHINDSFQIDLDDLLSKLDKNVRLLYLMHYFGALQPQSTLYLIRDAADCNGFSILEDATHSLFTASRTIGDYVIASIRKWIPIPHGGALITICDSLKLHEQKQCKPGDDGRAIGMVLKDLYLKDGLDCNPLYREIFINSERLLDKRDDCRVMSDFSKYCASCVSVSEIKRRRIENYSYLSLLFKELGLQSAVVFEGGECPFAFCIRLPNRDNLRKYLIDNRIYCAVHWPFDGYMEHDRPRGIKNGSELLSLPIDQRYTKPHMEYMAHVVSGYRGDLSF